MCACGCDLKTFASKTNRAARVAENERTHTTNPQSGTHSHTAHSTPARANFRKHKFYAPVSVAVWPVSCGGFKVIYFNYRPVPSSFRFGMRISGCASFCVHVYECACVPEQVCSRHRHEQSYESALKTRQAETQTVLIECSHAVLSTS